MKNRLNSVYLRTAWAVRKLHLFPHLEKKGMPSHGKPWTVMSCLRNFVGMTRTALSHAQLCKYGLILEQEINYLMDISIIDGIIDENRGSLSAISI